MSFIKNVLACMVAIFLFFAVFFVFAFAIGAASLSSLTAKQKVTVSSNTVLELKLNTPIGERGLESPFEDLGVPVGPQGKMGLDKIIMAIEAAKTDEDVEGILLDLSMVSAGLVKVEEIREAISEFKADTDKFVVAYGEGMSQKAYYLATVADKIYINPAGVMELKGFAMELSFFKNMLEKLDVEPKIFKVGKFKSAVEPFILDKMSDENREQLQTLLDDFYDEMVAEISKRRNVSEDEVHSIINELKIQDAEDAVELKMIDGAKYYDEVLAEIKTNLGKDDDYDLKMMKLSKYISAVDADYSGYKKNKVAVVYAEGGIEGGKGSEESIGSDKYAAILRKIRSDDNVKAVVMRVNSPGGSALASEVIWREIEMLKKKGIPVVTSMGDLAASGGYYIACNSDKIYADPYTITGSIGVFGVLVNMERFYNEKLGITHDEVKTARYSDFPNSMLLNDEMEPQEEIVIQNAIDKIYDLFLSRVAEGRGMEVDSVHKIAEGRVWSGKRALELGLVDALGGVDDAVKYVAELADLGDDYRVAPYPRAEDPVQRIMRKLQGDDEEYIEAMLQSQLGEQYKYMQKLRELIEMDEYQMRIPYEFELN